MYLKESIRLDYGNIVLHLNKKEGNVRIFIENDTESLEFTEADFDNLLVAIDELKVKGIISYV